LADSRIARLLAVTLTVSVAASAAAFGGWQGLLDLTLYLAALVPGLPLGFRLFGRRHAAGWVAGGLLGYTMTAIGGALLIRLGLATPVSTSVLWLLVTLVVWRANRRAWTAAPFVPAGAWTARHTAALLLVLHLVPALITAPLARVGARDAQGDKQYRAYFIADFIWHMALTQEVARHLEPRDGARASVELMNPYMFDKPIHYYWTYFVVPASMGVTSRSPVERVETALKVSAFGTALLMISTVFLAAWVAARRAWIAVAATTLAVVGPSPEGAYAFWQGYSWQALRTTNIDYMVGLPPWHGLRVDGLLRAMLYTPQHSLSFALGLMGVVAGLALGGALSLRGRLLVGAVLGASVVVNPFLGAIFTGVYGVAVLAESLSARRGVADLVTHGVTLVPVAAGLAWCVWAGMAGGVGGHLRFGYNLAAGHLPTQSFLLSLGTLFVPALLGLWPWRGAPRRPAVAAGAALVVAVLAMHFISLTDEHWVSFRAGNVLNVTLPILVARGVLGLTARGHARLGAAIVTAAILIGAPTAIVDARNAMDVENRAAGPGFFWTDVVTPSQQAGLTWLRRNTPPTAVVQAHRLPGYEDLERQDWSIIQSIAGRRAAAATFVSLLEEPENPERAARIHAMFVRDEAAAAHATALALGIDYLWLDQQDPFRVEFLQRIAPHKELFYAVFQQGDVYVIKIAR
jgi:hypothetical protein